MKRIRLVLGALLVASFAMWSPGPADAATTTVTVGTQSHVLNGTNIYRATNYLVQYTPAYGASTRTNQYGFEAAVVAGTVKTIADGVGNMAIPSNGYVLSGHGTARTWLKGVAKVGTPVTIGGAQPPPTSAAPVADLVLNPATGTAPFTLTADGSGSTDDVGVTSYAFSWGDGTASAPQSAATATHVYADPGSYTVTLTVKDADGNSASASKALTVTASSPTPPPDAPPVARVSVTPPSGTAPLAVQVDASASTDDHGISGYDFDFGDGSGTVSQPASTVQHQYTTAGTYTVRVTVTDTAGQRSSATASVTVTTSAPPPPPATKSTVVSLTFDDTIANQVNAGNVMAKYGVHGTFYINSPRIGTSGYLSKAQVDALVAAGDEIGGHTLGHKDLTTLSTSEATHQVCDDRAQLMALGYRVTSFAYPFGATDATAEQVVQSCGYNSARGVGDLRSPGYGCNSCATADTIPPVDRWQIKTPQSVQSDTTLAMLENYVTQAENDQGGWVPLLFHNVCSGCATNAVDVATFTAFVDWLSNRPSTTAVKTVDQVIGGAVQPPPSSSPPPPTSASSVTIGGSTRALDGTNINRSTNYLVRYTPAWGASTRTNQYGTEAAVVDGKITLVQTSVGNMAIPSNGYVLSGHGTANTWLKTYAKVGVAVTLN